MGYHVDGRIAHANHLSDTDTVRIPQRTAQHADGTAGQRDYIQCIDTLFRGNGSVGSTAFDMDELG